MRLKAKTIRCEAETWLQKNVPLIIESGQYKQGSALFITRDEGEDSGAFSDGPLACSCFRGQGRREADLQQSHSLPPH
jgi:hypothetical protein